MSAKPKMEFRIDGVEKVADMLESLSDSVQKTLVWDSATKAMEPVVEEARSKCPVDSGNLKESIGLKRIKMKGRFKKGLIVVSVGPRHGFDWAYSGANRNHKPFKYGIPVEYGHVNKKGGYVPGKNFMRESYFNQRESIVMRFNNELRKNVEDFIVQKRINTRMKTVDRQKSKAENESLTSSGL